MKVLDPGHCYHVNIYDLGKGIHSDLLRRCIETIQFMKREGENYPGNVGRYPGTNCQELIRVVIDRLKYVDNQIMDPANIHAIYSLRTALHDLEIRAARRHGLKLPAFKFEEIENLPTCLHCGHIVCGEWRDW